MTLPADPAWLDRVRELHSISQEGITYARSTFDVTRYTRLRELAAGMAASLAADGDPETVRVELLSEEGYLTPKLDVRAAVFDDDGRVLLVREVSDGRWTLPGGWADVGESLSEGAVRETWEESGYHVVARRLLGMYERERWGHPPLAFFTLKAVVGCALTGGEVRTSQETDAVAWFSRDDVPPLSLTRCSPRLLARVFEHHDDPALPPDID